MLVNASFCEFLLRNVTGNLRPRAIKKQSGMDMKIIVEENRIEGIVDLNGWRTPQTVISMHKTFGGYWAVSSSMCLPSGIDEARKVVECVNAAFAAMDKSA